jgi:hypothetical protein
MEELYKARRIYSMPQLNLETDCWIPKADVSWDEDGKQQHQLIAGPTDLFKIIEQAEIYAVEMAKSWIDAELIDNLTP